MTTATEAVKTMQRNGLVLHMFPGERITDSAILARIFWMAFHPRGLGRKGMANA